MPKITYILPDGSQRSLDAKVGDTVMDTAVSNGISGIVAECGGALACATCHVHVDSGYVGLIGNLDEFEDELLDGVATERDETSRLSCQIVISEDLEGLTVTIPDRQV
jgi:ferredoxin, 2Fe-2S